VAVRVTGLGSVALSGSGQKVNSQLELKLKLGNFNWQP
jgi:hypothetical protein